MKELVVISGKGGTGKTSITASFAVLAKNAVMADCDVDAADLHLILLPETIEKQDFYSGHEAFINQDKCKSCGLCLTNCRFDAIKKQSGKYVVDACEGCGVCVHFCPEKAIDFTSRLCGDFMVSKTRVGTMVHAKLGVAAENSGKLVSKVRYEAKRIAKEENKTLIIVDGPPGIGCPVIASLTGVDLALIVTEPTVSGEHDLMRILSLTKHFNIKTAICVNKWDINPEMTKQIEKKAQEFGAMVVGRIDYDDAFTKAQINNLAVVETNSPCSKQIKNIFNQLNLNGE